MQTTDFQVLHCTIPDIIQDMIPFTQDSLNSIALIQADSIPKNKSIAVKTEAFPS